MAVIKQQLSNCTAAELPAAAEALLPAAHVQRGVLAFVSQAQALLGPSYLQVNGW